MRCHMLRILKKNICTILGLLAIMLLVGCTSHEMGMQVEQVENIKNTGTVIEEKTKEMKEIYLAGGCFWGMQKYIDQFEGVIRTEVGYANGPDKAPSYQEVCNDSGHTETVRIIYDPKILSLTSLLEYYFMVIDPVSVNQQGHDIGIQYRTGIYYTEEDQIEEITAAYAAEEEKVGKKLAVEFEALKNFYSAEEYHQKYLDKNPGGYCHIPDHYFHMSDSK